MRLPGGHDNERGRPRMHIATHLAAGQSRVGGPDRREPSQRLGPTCIPALGTVDNSNPGVGAEAASEIIESTRCNITQKIVEHRHGSVEATDRCTLGNAAARASSASYHSADATPRGSQQRPACPKPAGGIAAR